MTPLRTCLVTGFPLDAARRVALELASGGDHVLLLARDKFCSEAKALADEISQTASGSLEVLCGDILALDLGLSGPTVCRLQADVCEIHHLAAIHYHGVQAPRMRQVNVDGLREVLELALGMRQLKRVCVWSTVFVAGNRTGTVFEHQLLKGQTFRNPYEKTKAQAEELARSAMAKLPITVVRVPNLLGDSRTGEAARVDGVYAVASAIVHTPDAVRLPVAGAHVLHVVPVDFAVAAAVRLTRHADAIGGTFHVVDERPLTARAFFDAVADAAGRPRPVVTLQSRLGLVLAKLPTLSGQTRHDHALLSWFENDVRFDNARSRSLLGGLSCPPVVTYIDTLVQWLRDRDD
ncbi:MAG: NAD-dependent epimerase/dehydratase family protein [Myxococcales bacterium]|nr:NAD-dependent epimerase/dehydratase family protein [Myxococcales bacterium]